MNEHGGLRKRARGTLIAAVAGFSLFAATAANAVITTTNDTNALGAAMSAPGMITATSQSFTYTCQVDDPGTIGFDETLCPTATSDSILAGFPVQNSTFTILTTGNAAFADDPNDSGQTGYSWFQEFPTIGEQVYDANTYGFTLSPATAGCLAFDFKFLSDEFPEFIGSKFNDAFVAQLNSANVTVDPVTRDVNAPGNFAAGAGDMISVNESGPSATSAAAAGGTTYDGATIRLTARTPVTVGATNTLYLTLFDQGDAAYDSAVFVDNLRYETIDPAKCKSLALDPAEGTIGVTPLVAYPKMAKDYSKLTFPVSCNLPPGELPCVVSSKAAFVATSGRIVSARAESLLAGVLLSRPKSTTIAADTNGVITLRTTQKGRDAIKAAIKKPGKLKAKARALLKQAQILRSQGKIAEAKRLEEKAAALKKRARKLAGKPLGVVKTTITNPSNGVSKIYKTVLKRP